MDKFVASKDLSWKIEVMKRLYEIFIIDSKLLFFIYLK